MLGVEPVEPGGQLLAAQPDSRGGGEIEVVAGVRVADLRRHALAVEFLEPVGASVSSIR